MTTEEFKAAVGKYPTGVTIVTTSFENVLYGFTANSFTSISLEPPLVSFCLDKKAFSLQAFLKTDYFAISILASHQRSLSVHFSRHSENKFTGVNYHPGALSGAPLIDEALAWIECKTWQKTEIGDHFLFIGESILASINGKQSPLLYFAKSYPELK